MQLPFLQSTLGKFELIPVITGSLDDKQLADAAALLGPLIDDDTLLVVSSDLSHYFPYELARSKDIPCITAVAAQDKAADQCDACGRDAIRILLSIARGRGWSGTVLDYRSSGDTSDNKERVVGYSAIAFHSPQEGAPEAPADRPSSRFPPLVKREFLHMARQILEAAVVSHQLPAIPVSPLLAPLLHDKTGCFVTLKKNGELRGCIGDIAPQRSPVECITDNVQNAALHDHRFPAVRGEELAALEVEISILTPPEPLTFRSPADLLSRLKAEKPGVVLATSDHSAAFLPQVWEDIPIGEEFLGALCRKAGLAPNAWREGPMSIFTYKALVFREKR